MRPIPLIALGAVLVAVSWVASYQVAESSIKPPPGRPPVVQHRPLVPVPLTGGMVLTRDGRSLVHTDPDRCTFAAFAQDDNGPNVRVTYEVLSDAGECDQARDHGLPFSTGTSTRVDLASGLEGRTVVDTTTGRPVPVIAEADVPELRAAPPGWSVDTRPYHVASAVSDFGRPDTLTAADWTAVSVDGMTGFLLVLVTTGRWNPPEGTAITPVRVRGGTGRAAAGIVVWTSGQRTYAVRWDPRDGKSVPDTATLVSVADSLAPGGGP